MRRRAAGWVECRKVDEDFTDPGNPAVTALTRGGLFQRGAVAGGALLAGGVLVGGLPSPADSASSAQQDEQTLTFLLELEELQAAFYAEASKRGRLKGETREFAQVVGDHEREHVAYLRKMLGAKAPKAQSFDFGDVTAVRRKFLRTAVEIEEAGLGAYTGAAPNLTAKTLAAGAKIVSVEARHTAWARDLAGENPAPHPTDKPSSETEVRAIVRKTGFVKSG